MATTHLNDPALEQEESFAELFAESLRVPRRTLRPGEKVSGQVVQVGRQRALLDLGQGSDGFIELTELGGVARVGDTVEAYIVGIENRVAVLAKSLGKGPGARAALEEASRTGVPVDGAVVEANKGGWVVEVAGVRCFCPLAQMDIRRVDDTATFVGQKLRFRITEWRSGRDVVVSRRALLEEERELERARLRERLKPGARLEGTVTAVRDFGAFVDLGGLEGLVPNSELGHGRIRAVDVLTVGQRVEVEVREVAPPGPKDKTERVTLSMRALAQDPWEVVLPELEAGDVLRGKVVRLQPFGAFVELVPGLDGLVHVSSLGRGTGRRIQHPADVVSVGDAIAVRVDSIDPVGRRLGLAFVPADEVAALTATSSVTESPVVQPVVDPAASASAPAAVPPGLRVRKTDGTSAVEGSASTVAAPALFAAAAPKASPVQKLGKQAVPADQAAEASPVAAAFAPPAVGQVVDTVVDKIEPFGLFVSWNGGASRGLLPMSELPVAKGVDLRRTYPLGTPVRAAVVEVRPEGKVRLSVTAVAQAEERAEASVWMRIQQSRPGAGGKGFGTFADLLRGARS